MADEAEVNDNVGSARVLNAEKALPELFESMQEGRYTIDQDFNLIEFHFEGLDGNPGGIFTHLLGRKCYEVFRNSKEKCLECPAVSALQMSVSTVMKRPDLMALKLSARTGRASPQRDENGNVESIKISFQTSDEEEQQYRNCYRVKIQGPDTQLRVELDPRKTAYYMGNSPDDVIFLNAPKKAKVPSFQFAVGPCWILVKNHTEGIAVIFSGQRLAPGSLILLIKQGKFTAGAFEIEINQQKRAFQVASELRTPEDKWQARRRFVLSKLWPEFDAKLNIVELEKRGTTSADIRRLALQTIREILESLPYPLGKDVDRDILAEDCAAEFIGLGPLEKLLKDPKIDEIMVNGADEVYVEVSGQISESPAKFLSTDSLMRVIDRIVSSKNRRLDESIPYVDTRLDDGSRVHAIIPPLAIDCPVLTIRKFPQHHLDENDLIRFGALTKDIATFVQLAVKYSQSIVVSGGTGSGKTTMLNILSRSIPPGERIITIEDSAELRLQQRHRIRLEARPPNIEGTGAVPIRELVRNALRMRPDRIVVGECRGAEAFDMLQAMNTGHEGSLTTVHANSCKDALGRIESMCLMAGLDLPLPVIRSQIVSGISYIIQLSRLVDGSRKCMMVAEISGIQDGVIQLAPIFEFRQTGLDKGHKVLGEYVATGVVPKFVQALKSIGVQIPLEIFQATK